MLAKALFRGFGRRIGLARRRSWPPKTSWMWWGCRRYGADSGWAWSWCGEYGAKGAEEVGELGGFGPWVGMQWAGVGRRQGVRGRGRGVLGERHQEPRRPQKPCAGTCKSAGGPSRTTSRTLKDPQSVETARLRGPQEPSNSLKLPQTSLKQGPQNSAKCTCIAWGTPSRSVKPLKLP